MPLFVLPVSIRSRDPGRLVVITSGEFVPTTIKRPRDGGKPPASKLLRPVKWSGKRAEFLKWFLVKPRMVEETMAALSMTRANVFAYWTMIHRDHGIGYSLSGNVIAVLLPDGSDTKSIWSQP